jgi:hypothetical protein
MKRTLAIADTHGHWDRLFALLVQEGIVDPKTEKRIDHNVEVVQLGDLGHFGQDGSPTGDMLCYQSAMDWCDVVLWGNHDRAVVDPDVHGFVGQHPISYEMKHIFELLHTTKMKLAWEAHGFLLTHAGLHASFFGKVPFEGDVRKLAIELNQIEKHSKDRHPVIDAIGPRRQGRAVAGGVLWRDTSEKLASIPQVFGHSKGKRVRTYFGKDGVKSYCIDVGSRDNGWLIGMWLPEEKTVEVKVSTKDITYGPGWPE